MPVDLTAWCNGMWYCESRGLQWPLDNLRVLAAHKWGASYVNTTNMLCGPTPCPVIVNQNVQVMIDRNHASHSSWVCIAVGDLDYDGTFHNICKIDTRTLCHYLDTYFSFSFSFFLSFFSSSVLKVRNKTVLYNRWLIDAITTSIKLFPACCFHLQENRANKTKQKELSRAQNGKKKSVADRGTTSVVSKHCHLFFGGTLERPQGSSL